MLNKKIFFTNVISLLALVFALGGAIPVFAQEAGISTSSYDSENNNAQSITTSVYNPDEIDPANGSDPGGVAGLLINLKKFGQDVGMVYVDPRIIMARVIKSGMGFIGIIVLIIILWSGLSIMLSGGDEEKSQSAKRTFINMLIGLFIMFSAYSIVIFVMKALNNTVATDRSDYNQVIRDPVVNP
jgi:hypothetical protein